MENFSIEEQHKAIKTYYESVFLGYVRNDIASLLNPELDEKGIGGCSVPLAISILSSMNQLGYLTSNKEVDVTETEYCIKKFCGDWMSKTNKLYDKETFQELIVHFYRHSMSHQFLPLHSVGITRDPRQKTVLEFGSGEIYCALQVKILAENLLHVIELIYEKINKAIENDHEFIRRFFLRLNKEIDKNLKPDDKELTAFTTTKTTVSGTTTSVTS
jgi:hypothetical protein